MPGQNQPNVAFKIYHTRKRNNTPGCNSTGPRACSTCRSFDQAAFLSGMRQRLGPKNSHTVVACPALSTCAATSTSVCCDDTAFANSSLQRTGPSSWQAWVAGPGTMAWDRSFISKRCLAARVTRIDVAAYQQRCKVR